MEKRHFLTGKDEWSGRRSRGEIKSVLFADLFHKYLRKSVNKTCLEIGCISGRFLAYIAKNFGYFPEGIDYVKNTKKITEETLKNNGIKQSVIYEADFVKWKIPKKYDLVCSFGFIEHFTGKLNEDVFQKHIELLKPGGILFMDIPNFNYGQYIFHYYLDRKNLDGHNVKIMNLSYFKKMATLYNLQILSLNYYGGSFHYWGLDKNASLLKKIIYKTLRNISKITKKISFLNNRFFSPFIVFVAKKY